MFTSDKMGASYKMAKLSLIYLLCSIFCALFGGVYECFSHEVYSYSMLYAFAFPLVGGALPFLLFAMHGQNRIPGVAARYLYHFGISALTVGSILKGVLEIYGTSNKLLNVYWYAGSLLILLGIFVYLLSMPKRVSQN